MTLILHLPDADRSPGRRGADCDWVGPGRPIALSGIAAVPAANPKTGTAYVPVQSSHIVDVINAAKCNAKVTSDYRVIARARVGNSPLAAAVDEKTGTIYVANGPRTPPGPCRC